MLAAVAVIATVELSMAAVRSAYPVPPLVATGINRLLEIVLLLGMVIRLNRSLETIGFSAPKWRQGLKRGLLWSAGFGLIAGIGFSVLYFFKVQPLALIGTRLPGQPRKLLLLFVVGGLIAPVAEEIFFRGILYGFLRRWGAFVAVAVSTTVFVTLHPTQGFSLTQLVGGIVFAIAYEIEDNLLVPISIHVMGNSAIFAVSLIF